MTSLTARTALTPVAALGLSLAAEVGVSSGLDRPRTNGSADADANSPTYAYSHACARSYRRL